MKKFSKVCISSLICLTSCIASADNDIYSRSAAVDLFLVGSDPSSDLSKRAFDNCKDNGGFTLFEKIGHFLEVNGLFSNDEKSITDFVFDPALNNVVPRFLISNKGRNLFYEMGAKVDTKLKQELFAAIERDYTERPSSYLFKDVVTAVKESYNMLGVRYDYERGQRKFIIDPTKPTSPLISEMLGLYRLHNKIIVATEKKKVCSPEFIDQAWAESMADVANLKYCTVEFNSVIPFAAKGTDLTCDGQKFVILGSK